MLCRFLLGETLSRSQDKMSHKLSKVRSRPCRRSWCQGCSRLVRQLPKNCSPSSKSSACWSIWAIHLPVSPPTNVISLAFQEVSHDLLKPSRSVMRSFRPMQLQSKSEHAIRGPPSSDQCPQKALKKNIRNICEPCGFRINGAYGFFRPASTA